jgi:hypothetical protein
MATAKRLLFRAEAREKLLENAVSVLLLAEATMTEVPAKKAEPEGSIEA